MSCISAFQPTDQYLSTVVFNGDGATTEFNYTFDYLNKDVWTANNPDTADNEYNPYLRVYVDGVQTAYRMSDSETIVLDTAPDGGESNVIIRRDSSIDARAVDYVEGSVLTETNLDRDSKQAFFLIQELHDRALDLQCRTDGRYINSYLFTSTTSQTTFDCNTTSSSTNQTSETLLLNREEVLVYLNGVLQQARATNYSTSLYNGVLRITLVTAPANGTSVEIRTMVSGVSQAVNLPANAVTTSKIANGAVTWPKTNFNAAGSNGTFLCQRSAVATWDTIGTSDVSGLSTYILAKRLDQFAAPTTSVTMNSRKIVSLGTPTSSTDAATKGYVDALVATTYVPQMKKAISTTNSATYTTITVPFTWDYVQIDYLSDGHYIQRSTTYAYGDIGTSDGTKTVITFGTSGTTNLTLWAYHSGNDFLQKATGSTSTSKTIMLTFYKNAAGV